MLVIKDLSKYDYFYFHLILLLSPTAVSLDAGHWARYFTCVTSEPPIRSKGVNRGSERLSGRSIAEN